MLAAAGRLSIAGTIGTAMTAAGAGTQAAAAAFDDRFAPALHDAQAPRGLRGAHVLTLNFLVAEGLTT
jgi:hypothetical protein